MAAAPGISELERTVSRSKDKGTAAETMFVNYLVNNGWPYAERRALAGVLDKGDVSGTPGLVWEVKHVGRNIKMAEWIAETVVERDNAKAEHGILVMKPRGYGAARVGEWFAAMAHPDFKRLQLNVFLGGQVGELIGHGLPAMYRQSSLRDHLSACRTEWPGRFAVLSLMPPGARDNVDDWYRVTTVAEIVPLLRLAGFGTPWPA